MEIHPFWAFCLPLVPALSPPRPGIHLLSKSIPSGSAQDPVHDCPHQDVLCACTGIHAPPGTDRRAHSLPRSTALCPYSGTPTSRLLAWTVIPGPGAFADGAVFLPAAAQRADVGGEAAGTSINHSQALLQRLQELLRQGNASDVVLRVQAAGTDEVRVFHAHRLLLGLHSQRFRELLSNQSEVLLQEPGDCAAVFDKFIRWGGDGFGGRFIPSQASGSLTHGVPEARAP